MRRSPWRTGVASTHADRPAAAGRASADQCASSPQPKRSGGNGSSGLEGAACKATTGPISTKAVSRTTLAARRRVTAQAACERCAVGRLGEPQAEALGQEHEGVQEAGGQRDVVVERPAASRSPRPGARPAARLRFSNFPRPPTGRVAKCTSWRERSSSRAGGGEQVGRVLALDAERQHAARRAARGRPRQPPAATPWPAATASATASRASGPAGGADAPHLPGGAGEEVARARPRSCAHLGGAARRIRPARVGGHHDAVGAAAAHGVPQAPGQHAQLAPGAGGAALAHVVAARGAPERVAAPGTARRSRASCAGRGGARSPAAPM